jgi:hypothetical protein
MKVPATATPAPLLPCGSGGGGGGGGVLHSDFALFPGEKFVQLPPCVFAGTVSLESKVPVQSRDCHISRNPPLVQLEAFQRIEISAGNRPSLLFAATQALALLPLK